MIDLPGIARVAVGDQPENIYQQITDMIMEYIKPEESIILNINERLNASVLEFNKLPRILTSVPDAMAVFMQIVGSLKETFQKILIRGELEYDDNEMHCNARLAEMLDEFSKELHESDKFSENFLVVEMEILKEANGIRLPNFLPNHAFLCLLKRKVNSVSDLPIGFVNKVWEYLEVVSFRVLIDHCGNYPQLLPSIKKASQNVILRMKEKFIEKVIEMMDMEEVTDNTCDPDYIASCNKLMGSGRDEFLKAVG
ncbi:hypothetical protein L2E82_37732 [Cichorium intybus]|uniref:Uncharacterized protein n=1 Tax=Cichorium intybus TaxID=13427 RepID=A0ACB9AGN3_CICIN|nr:hypothetical protein L2E82_37732 [Cichorium intybus]